ncbi:MAG: TrbI/VirB10 family protein [Verrucomicrobiota bacterium]
MNPRDFLGFFKTKSGKLVLFAAIFGGVLMLFSALRNKAGSGAGRGEGFTSGRTNRTDRAQVVQTVERPMALFRPPLPKPEPSSPKTNETPKVGVLAPKPEPASPPLPPLSLFSDSGAGAPEPKSPPTSYAPFGRLIPCETVVTVDSASIQTPIIGLITEDIYHSGRLVIPAGTEVHGSAQTDRHRERIASGGSWTLVWQTGEELRLKAIVLDREFSGDLEGWGITDGSAGLRGRIIKTDDLAEIKLFAATLLSGAASALTEKQTTLFGTIDSRSLNNAPLKGAQDVLQIYAQRILDTIQRDGFYVRVPSGKQFYLYVLQTIDRSDAAINGTAPAFAEESNASIPSPGGLPSTAFRSAPEPAPNSIKPKPLP